MKDEDLGKLLNDIWNELASNDATEWETLPQELKNIFSVIGRRIYDAGFQAGADSVNQN